MNGPVDGSRISDGVQPPIHTFGDFISPPMILISWGACDLLKLLELLHSPPRAPTSPAGPPERNVGPAWIQQRGAKKGIKLGAPDWLRA